MSSSKSVSTFAKPPNENVNAKHLKQSNRHFSIRFLSNSAQEQRSQNHEGIARARRKRRNQTHHRIARCLRGLRHHAISANVVCMSKFEQWQCWGICAFHSCFSWRSPAPHGAAFSHLAILRFAPSLFTAVYFYIFATKSPNVESHMVLCCAHLLSIHHLRSHWVLELFKSNNQRIKFADLPTAFMTHRDA